MRCRRLPQCHDSHVHGYKLLHKREGTLVDNNHVFYIRLRLSVGIAQDGVRLNYVVVKQRKDDGAQYIHLQPSSEGRARTSV